VINSRLFLLYLLLTGIALNLFIPPFQNPDEIQHFGMILTYYNAGLEQSVVESEIITLIDNNQWWAYTGMGKPASHHLGLSEIKRLKFTTFRASLNNRVLYHYIMATVLKLFPKVEPLMLYYLCRLFSFLFILMAVFFTFLTFKRLSVDGKNYWFYGLFFLLFLPQFLIISISVNSDSLVILLGCLFFYSSFFLITEAFRYFHFIAVILTSLAGAIFDKSSLYMLPLVFVLMILCSKNKKLVRATVVTIIAAIMVAPWIIWHFPISFFNNLKIIRKTLSLNPTTALSFLTNADFNHRFFVLMIDSFLLKFGWMSYFAHKTAYTIWRIILAVAGLGVLFFPITQFKTINTRLGQNQPDSKQKKLVVFSASAFLIQLGAIWIFYGGKDVMAQGRHLFSLLIPFFFLFVMGINILSGMVHFKLSKAVLATLVLLEFIFLSFIIWFYVIPIFHLSVKSPHPGL